MIREPDEKTASSAGTWAIWTFVAVLMYLLSPGLFLAVIIRGGWKPSPALEKPLTIIYSPIVLLAKWKPVADIYSSYLSWCADEEVRFGP
jgi:hypothetical protein